MQLGVWGVCCERHHCIQGAKSLKAKALWKSCPSRILYFTSLLFVFKVALWFFERSNTVLHFWKKQHSATFLKLLLLQSMIATFYLNLGTETLLSQNRCTNFHFSLHYPWHGVCGIVVQVVSKACRDLFLEAW